MGQMTMETMREMLARRMNGQDDDGAAPAEGYGLDGYPLQAPKTSDGGQVKAGKGGRMNLQTVRQVCKELGISEATVRRAVSGGKLQVLKIGNRQLVDMDKAMECLQDLLAPEGATIEEVSRATGLSVSGIRRGIKEGWLPAEKPGKAYVFDLDKVISAIETRMGTGSGN